jgi:hypothetical protein
MLGSIYSMALLAATANHRLTCPQNPVAINTAPAFKFSEYDHFVDAKNGNVIATSPDGYIDSLVARQVKGVLISYGNNSRLPSELSERMSAGFVGGGNEFLLMEFSDVSLQYWRYSSTLGNRDRADQRIWQNYFVAGATVPRQILPISLPDLDYATDKLFSTLENARKLCQKDISLRESNWEKLFTETATGLRDLQVADDQVNDIWSRLEWTLQQRALFNAASKAWVFGGMGSWNDTSPSDMSLQPEYERVSAQLFDAVNSAVVATVNVASPATHLPKLTGRIDHPNQKSQWWKFWQ